MSSELELPRQVAALLLSGHAVQLLPPLSKHAYRQIVEFRSRRIQAAVCMAPSIPLLGLKLNVKYFLDISLPCGAGLPPLECARTTRALVRLLRKEDFYRHCYLDDFIGLEATKDKAEKAYARVVELAATLGLDLASKKCSPPHDSLVRF